MRAVSAQEKAGWKVWWQWMWVVTTVTWIPIAFLYPITGKGKVWVHPTWTISLVAFLALFLLPELISVRKGDDALPPLTHMIRGYLPDDLVFPAMYLLVGSLGGRWFGFSFTRYAGLGVIAAILGWLTIHFTMAYMGPNPRPGAPPETPRPRLKPLTHRCRFSRILGGCRIPTGTSTKCRNSWVVRRDQWHRPRLGETPRSTSPDAAALRDHCDATVARYSSTQPHVARRNRRSAVLASLRSDLGRQAPLRQPVSQSGSEATSLSPSGFSPAPARSSGRVQTPDG